MTQTIDQKINAFKELRLPKLQAKFHDIVGEKTRSPNKTFLLRRIREALEAQEAKAAAASSEPESITPQVQLEPPQKDETLDVETKADQSEPEAVQPKRLSQHSVTELRALYRDTIGRETSSNHRSYLIWKIRQAQKGRIPVGPVQRKTKGEPSDFRVLPLRLPTPTVEALDEARVRMGLPNRMVLFRQALNLYLEQAGEDEVAALFARGTTATVEASRLDTEGTSEASPA